MPEERADYLPRRIRSCFGQLWVVFEETSALAHVVPMQFVPGPDAGSEIANRVLVEEVRLLASDMILPAVVDVRV